MTMIWQISAVLLGTIFIVSCDSSPGKNPVTEREKSSYALGYQTGKQLTETFNTVDGSEFPVDQEAFLRGIDTALYNKHSALDETELVEYAQLGSEKIEEFLTDKRAEFEQEQEAMEMEQEAMEMEQEENGMMNAEIGEKFLEENKDKAGVMTTKSGMQYIIEKPGNDIRPTVADEVTVHYRGTLIDGTEFDSSYARNEPATFTLGGLIEGWKEGIPLIGEGGKMKLFLAPNLAYGERGAGDVIGPNSTLIFEIELISVNN